MVAVCCSVLQCDIATRQSSHILSSKFESKLIKTSASNNHNRFRAKKVTSNSNALQHTASRYIKLHHTASHCITLQQNRVAATTTIVSESAIEFKRTATHCNTLQHIATHCNTLHHTASHCITLQHTASNHSCGNNHHHFGNCCELRSQMAETHTRSLSSLTRPVGTYKQISHISIGLFCKKALFLWGLLAETHTHSV